MGRWTLWCSLGWVACTPPEPVAPDPLDVAWEAALGVAARIHNEVDCDQRITGWLCYGARLPGEPDFPLPDTRRTYLGLTGLVRSSRAVPDGVSETLMTTELTVEPEGVWLSNVRPDSPEARDWYVPVVSAMAATLRGEAVEIPITPDLAAWFREPLPGHYTLDRDEHGYKFVGVRNTRLVHVAAVGSAPPAWVMYENQQGGTFVTIFPDVAMVVR